MDYPHRKHWTDTARARGFELGSDGPSLLVVGIDGSDTAWRALYYAFGLARRQGATLVAVFSFTPIISGFGCPGVYYSGEELAAELRAAVAALAAEHQVATEFVATQRDPVTVLTELAADRHADAIVMGVGRKAARTIRRSRCPVTVVP
jgi:nucleotide-binding universal stress UspA family protein